MTDEHFLTTDEVLDYLQVNLRTIYRLIKARKLPAVRVGRQWRFRKQDIDAWLSSGRGRVEARGAARILLVDDEEAVRDLVGKTLHRAEYDVDIATDGPTALEKLRATEYDLLITDLKMPGMDGLTLMRETRRLWPDMPIVIITGFSTEASAVEAINLGVSGYLIKPFRLPRIISVTARALGETMPTPEELDEFSGVVFRDN